jgi:hypothetical protein
VPFRVVLTVSLVVVVVVMVVVEVVYITELIPRGQSPDTVVSRIAVIIATKVISFLAFIEAPYLLLSTWS